MVGALKSSQATAHEHVGTRSVGVRLSEILKRDLRLEASAYDIEA